MSAWVHDPAHIAAMIRAGMEYGQGRLSWLAPGPIQDGDFERGQVWGPQSIAHAQDRRRELTFETINEVGRMLLTQNVRSVAFRYDETMDSDDLPGPVGFQLNAVRFDPMDVVRRARRLSPVETLKAINSYEYQSCENPEWPASEAHVFCNVLRDHAISKLPGFDEANVWAIEAVTT